jgi:hypothetical protein
MACRQEALGVNDKFWRIRAISGTGQRRQLPGNGLFQPA